MKRSQVKEIVLHLSFGLFGTVTDLTLYTFFLTLASFGKQPTYYGYDQAFNEASKLLSQLNHKTILKALISLKKKDLVTYSKKQLHKTIAISPKGIDYLQQLLPKYRENKHWGGRIYLITYDIPELKHRHRDMLRKFLVKIGAAMLQESVWLIFKNPKSMIQSFVEEKQLDGVIIVSNMGTDATIGDEDLLTLIRRIYKLDLINARYAKFLDYIRNKKQWTLPDMGFYLSILKDDPQLPLELVGEDWLGEKTHLLYQKKMDKISTNH